MSTYRTVRRIARSVIEHTPYVDRLIMPSAGYKVLTRQAAEQFNEVASGWHSKRSARWQERSYRGLLKEMYAGVPRLDFRVLAEAIEETGIMLPSVLEVGCGNGYYNEILAHLVRGGVSYTGLDYSRVMVESAQLRYPDAMFVVGDATKLDFIDGAFDIVLNGVSLLHILDYVPAIREAARVSKAYVVFSCVPVSRGRETVYLSKFAYGEPTVEIIFSEPELLELFDRAGLDVVKVWQSLEYDLRRLTGTASTMLTYLCRKRT